MVIDDIHLFGHTCEWDVANIVILILSYRLYSCSPRRASRKLFTVYKTVSCMQQLPKRYASRTCYYAHALLCAIAAYRLFHSHAQVLTFTDPTRWQEYKRVDKFLYSTLFGNFLGLLMSLQPYVWIVMGFGSKWSSSAYNEKSKQILPTCDSLPLIMSHIHNKLFMPGRLFD